MQAVNSLILCFFFRIFAQEEGAAVQAPFGLAGQKELHQALRACMELCYVMLDMLEGK